MQFPGPDRSAPNRVAPLVREISSTESHLDDAIHDWLAAGGELPSKEGHSVALGALWQQKLMRRLVIQPATARKVIARLPSRVARFVKKRVEAGAGLRSLTSPITGRITLKTTPPTPYEKLQRFYRQGERRFDIPAEILASLNFVESKFGRLLGPSSAGAQGPMQFIPSTWATYGHGDINDPRDSIIAAARYLKASGAPHDMRGALFAYNRSLAYVDAVLIYASEMARRSDAFLDFYFWQVFVRTHHGDVQLTGPGH